MFSSFKNAEKVHRRAHKERGQLSSRQKVGLLEKKKDYKQRARDYHIKQKRIKVLKEKARNRNPDEFYYKMINSKMTDGEHFQKNKIPPPEKKERVRALCRDLFQIEGERRKLDKEIQDLQVSLSLMPGMPDHDKRRHVVFFDDDKEAEQFNNSADKQAEYFDTHKALLENPANRMRSEQLANDELPTVHRSIRKKSERQYQSKMTRLDEALKQRKQLDHEYNQITERKNSLTFRRRRGLQKTIIPTHRRR
ncbi:probable U3 small nucleolar RNA-associated protein 11 [Sycon ciliatum]|uniref:probable U3 small nucleolar RNA-associated protein 11 n=1 Tax=Sycon ciliatum TaxID=27933 RepID=UPI0020AA68EF|eukprot:scpid87227/ scgid14086/ Probable U3 small nucleolar RNA-associated protein 11; UTP11-like protein